ncbi:MAG TPA: glycerate kinase [Anaerolineales bacterium]|nr:glycerate kinase [Anaerolineales bacterium]
MDLNGLDAYSMRGTSWRQPVLRILTAALDRVEPAAAIARHVKRAGEVLTVDGRQYSLRDYRRVFVIGAGKAGAPMARAVSSLLEERLTRGIVIVKEGYGGKGEPGNIEILEAGHPQPDERSVLATGKIIELLEEAREDDLVLGLISGGGSALLSAPVAGVGLEDLQELTSDLLKSGANINEINTLRKHLEQVKGGQLARLAAPATMIALILSDVVGSPLDVIASGPTAADPSTYRDALRVLTRHDLMEKTEGPILSILQRGAEGQLAETPKPDDPLFERVQNVVVGSNLQAAEAAVDQAIREGFNSMLLTTYLQGEARQAGRLLAAILRQIAESEKPLARPACLVVGGETTVTIGGDGLGGRNQEMALGAVQELAGLRRVAMLTFATDGGDGPTDAAGAIVTGETWQRSLQAKLDPLEFLRRNDSYHFFQKLGDLLLTGPTLTNVNDLAVLFAF